MSSKTYKKLIAKQFAQDFKSAIEIIELPIPEPAPDEIVIRNKFAGVNAGFDTLVPRSQIPPGNAFREALPPKIY